MQKSHKYSNIYLESKVIRRVIAALGEFSSVDYSISHLSTETGNTTWTYDNIDEFFDDYKKKPDSAELAIYYTDKTINESNFYRLQFKYNNNKYIIPGATFHIAAPDKRTINTLYDILDEAALSAETIGTNELSAPISIFIGHGRSSQWRDLKDHLVDKHYYRVEAYETGARAGHTIRDILDDMLSKSTFALLVLTAEDEMNDGNMCARQNVIHETGLFQGKLGFNKAIVLMEEGAEEFSNIFGIQQLRFGKGNIKEIFGDVLATIKREFIV